MVYAMVLFSPPVFSVPAEQQMDGALRRSCAERHQAPWSCPNTRPSPAPKPPRASPPGPHTQQVQCLALQAPVPSPLEAACFLLLLTSLPPWVDGLSREMLAGMDSSKLPQMEEQALTFQPSVPVCSSPLACYLAVMETVPEVGRGCSLGDQRSLASIHPHLQVASQTRQEMRPDISLLGSSSFLAHSNSGVRGGIL